VGRQGRSDASTQNPLDSDYIHMYRMLNLNDVPELLDTWRWTVAMPSNPEYENLVVNELFQDELKEKDTKHRKRAGGRERGGGGVGPITPLA
jgi:hypothetical protein